MRNTLISVLITSAVLSSGISFAQDNAATSPDDILLGAEGEDVVSSVDADNAQLNSSDSDPDLTVESLADSISAAYQRNPSILAQRKIRMIADERLSQAHALKRPQVSVSSSAGYAISRNGRTAFADFEAPQTTFGLEVRQSLWNGGRNDAAIGEAAAGVTQAESQLFAFEQDMILNVVTNYMDVLASEAEVDIRKNNVSVLVRQVEAASDRFEVGEVTRTDVAQAQARYSGAKAQLSTAQANLVANRAVFQELVGRWPTQLEAVNFTPDYPEGLDDAINAAMEYNPDLVASKASVKASEQRLRSAKGQNRPDISIVGAAGLSQTYQDDTFNNENASVVAQLTLPLYTGGRISSQIRASALERDQLRLQHRAAERSVLVQVTRAWHSALASQRTIEASQQQVEAAQIAFDGAEQELAVGLRTTLDLLDQEQELLDAQLALVQANRTHYIAVHQLLAAMGALTPESLGVNLSL
ncbi:TolC family outer membrane protein [Hirschia baltica]|uniref:Type I secretion outer membrane protein, TolC family n=1 Tax=Hirschia baltica (strain ATCC 49814 / DSM 5838 / IFAM 1418) TaxID=582402 RepID=C6XIS4_HIRBI|nr:TolC family outer membrane protein [Hirschia baltica]ACT59019.1 type I secretion outer membrane protein, TolC family [Hirschia baltica ATCC 49814]